MAKVLELHTKTPDEPNAELVAFLKALLERAESGTLRAVGVALSERDGFSAEKCGDAEELALLLAAVPQLQEVLRYAIFEDE